MHQLFAYLIAQQQADRIREARESQLAERVRRERALEARANPPAQADGFDGLDARRALALAALGLGRAAATTSRLAARTSRAAAGTARRIDPCLDEGVIRRAVGVSGR